MNIFMNTISAIIMLLRLVPGEESCAESLDLLLRIMFIILSFAFEHSRKK